MVPAEGLTSDGRYLWLAKPTRIKPTPSTSSVLDFQGTAGRRTVATVARDLCRPGFRIPVIPLPTVKGERSTRGTEDCSKQLDPAACGEVSALVRGSLAASGKASLMLYRAVWHYALSQRYECLLVSCNARLLPPLQDHFRPVPG